MPTTNENSAPRPPLTRERIFRAAVSLADRSGVAALTMRRLGGELGVEAMSLYKHVADKEEILDGAVELVVSDVSIPTPGTDWKDAMRRRAFSAREVLGRHPWAVGLMESRASVGESTLRYMNAIIGSLREAGFEIEMAAHAFWLLDSYVYGHVIQETSLPFTTSEQIEESVGEILGGIEGDEYPHLVEMGEHAMTSGYDFGSEFEFGLELILDALDRILTRRSPAT